MRSNLPRLEPVVIQIPEAIEPEQVAQVEPLAPVNDLVESARSAIDLAEPESIVQTLLINEQISSNEQRKRDEYDAIALIMILAEID